MIKRKRPRSRDHHRNAEFCEICGSVCTPPRRAEAARERDRTRAMLMGWRVV